MANIYDILKGLKVTSQFGEQRPDHVHKGVDLAEQMGAPIRSAISGIVKGIHNDPQGYGNYIDIEDPISKILTRYAHAQGFKVKPNEKITAGEVIGSAGSTGNSTGPHLHFELQKDGQTINPMELKNMAKFIGKGTTFKKPDEATTKSMVQDLAQNLSGVSDIVKQLKSGELQKQNTLAPEYQGMTPEQLISNVQQGKNLGVPSIKGAIDKYNADNSAMGQNGEIKDTIKNAAMNANQPQSPETDLKNQALEYAQKYLSQGMQKPQTGSDIAADLLKQIQSKNIGGALKDVGDYAGTSGYSDFAGNILGLLGKTQMANSMYKQGDTLREREKDALDKYNEKGKNILGLLKTLQSGTKGSQRLGDALDTALATGMITEDEFNKIVSSPQYHPDLSLGGSSLNKYLEKFLIGKRQEGSEKLEDKKQGNRKEIAGIKQGYTEKNIGTEHTNKMEEIGYGKSIPQIQTPEKTAETIENTKKIKAQTEDIKNKVNQPKKQTAEQQKLIANAQSGLDQINAIKNLINTKGRKALLNPLDLKTQSEFGFYKRELSDVITRLRTGAALNEEEQKFYGDKQMPNFADVIKPDVIFTKLNTYEKLFKKILGENTASTGGGSMPTLEEIRAERARRGK